MKNTMKTNHFCRLLTSILIAGIFVCLTLLSSSAASRESDQASDTQDSYVLYVGNTAVTKENCEDVLGDKAEDPEAVPRVVYDPNRNVLTLQDVELTSGTEVEGKYYSLVCTRPEVSIEVKGTVTMKWGIYITNGSVSISDAQVTFCGEDGGTGYVQIQSGALQIDKSIIVGESISGVEDVCFGADRIQITGSTCLIRPNKAKITPFGCVLYAKETMLIENNSMIDYKTNYPCVNAFLESDGNVTISDSSLSAVGATSFIVVNQGKLTIQNNAKLIATDCTNGIYVGGDAEFDNAQVFIQAFQSGILNNPDGETSFRARKTIFTISNPGYEALERGVLTRQWEENKDVFLQAFGTYENYVIRYRTDYDTAVASIRHSGFYANNSAVTLTHTTMSVNGYMVGVLFRSENARFSAGNGTTFNLSATRASFLAVVKETDNVRMGSNLKGNAMLFSLPATSVLGSYGNIVLTLVQAEQTLRQTGNTLLTDPTQILDSFEGFITDCSVTVYEFPIAAIAIPCAFLIVACAIAILVYNSCRKLKTQKNSRKKY